MDIDQLYAAALAAQKSGQAGEAERLYRQILEQASPPEVLVNLGNLLARQRRHARGAGAVTTGRWRRGPTSWKACSTAPICCWS